MRRPTFIARQASCPTGLLGRLLGKIMAVETASANDKALELLDIGPNDRVLEIGFGHGRTIARAATLASAGFVAGVEVSATMLQMATRYNQHLINAGRVALYLTQSSVIPYPDRSFDRVLAVHTLYFWTEPLVHLQEIYRVMKDDARLVLCFTSKEDSQVVNQFPATVYRFYNTDEVVQQLREVGFSEISLERQHIRPRSLAFAVAHRHE